jgi:hypothetical protein
MESLVYALEADGYSNAQERFRSPVLRVIIRGALKAGWKRKDNPPTVS